MLDFLLVLGQIPGTSFYITFTELVVGAVLLYARWYELRHRREIRMFLKRQQKKLVLAYRRRVRRLKMLRRQTYQATIGALILAVRRLKRRIQLRIRRTKRAIIFALAILPRRNVRRLKMRIRRTRRNITGGIYKHYRRVVRKTLRKIHKFEKRLKEIAA